VPHRLRNTAARHPFDTFAFVLRNARSAVFQPPPGRCLVLLANRKGRASAEWESAGEAVAMSRRQGSSHGKLWEELGDDEASASLDAEVPPR
jgi:hypothetical protein